MTVEESQYVDRLIQKVKRLEADLLQASRENQRLTGQMHGLLAAERRSEQARRDDPAGYVDAFLAEHGDDPRVQAWWSARDPDSLQRLALAGVDLRELFAL